MWSEQACCGAQSRPVAQVTQAACQSKPARCAERASVTEARKAAATQAADGIADPKLRRTSRWNAEGKRFTQAAGQSQAP